MTQTINVTSQSNLTHHFHAPAPRTELKNSAQAHLMKLISRRGFPQRDQDLLLALDDVGILTRDQIQQLFFPSKSRAIQRLKILYDKHLLNAGGDYWYHSAKNKVDFIYQEGSTKTGYSGQSGLVKSFAYTPSLVGRHYISLLKELPLQKISFDPVRYNPAVYNHLTLHDLWISEAYVKLRLASEKFGLPFAWRNEARSIINDRNDSSKEIVRPDATFITSFSIQPDAPLQQSAKFIEMDRGATRWEHKVDLYNHAYEDGNWKKLSNQFPIVLCVVPDYLYKKSIRQIETNLDSVEFCVTSWSEFLKDPLSWFSVNAEENISILPPHYRK